MKRSETVLFLSDLHIPFEHGLAVHAIYRAAKDLNPTHIIYGGDIVDFDTLSRFGQSKPEADWDAWKGVNGAREHLYQRRDEFPKAKFYFLHGNHDARLEKYVLSHAPKVAKLVPRLSEHLDLEKLKIEVIPWQGWAQIGKLSYAHGDNWPVGYGAANPAKCIWDRARQSLLVGHFHRESVYHQKDFGGSEYSVVSVGCLCQPMPYNLYANWQIGAGLVHYSHCGSYRIAHLSWENGELIYPKEWGRC